MVNGMQHDVIVNTELGQGTGDMRYQTADGKWWVEWDGRELGTGHIFRMIYLWEGAKE